MTFMYYYNEIWTKNESNLYKSFGCGCALYDYMQNCLSDDYDAIWDSLNEAATQIFGITQNAANLTGRALVEMLNLAILDEIARELLDDADEE